MKTKFLYSLMLTTALLFGGWLTHTSAQTTEGKEFWVSFMRSDASNPENLSLTFSAKRACEVTVFNDYTGFNQVVQVEANSIATIEYLNNDKPSCYVDATNQVLTGALHITSTDTISVFASNYRTKSVDATGVLPITALRSEYYVQNFPAWDHKENYQGSHFCIVAIDDNTVVEYTPTESIYDSQTGSRLEAHKTYLTDTLQKGQVWYVWTGDGTYDEMSDLSGTHVLAHDGKRIAVFCGNPHTNIPHKEDRDHIYEQAMPVDFWGTQFVITGSMLTKDRARKLDYVKITALDDNTTIYKNGTAYETIDFSKYSKRTITMEVDSADVFYLSSSCPVEVFLYMTSNRVDDPKGKTNGDPAMVWINPIEQQLNDITFISYKVIPQGSTLPEHFVNIVTDTATAKTMTFDGQNIGSTFKVLEAMPYYAYSQYWISNDLEAKQHHLKSGNGGGFIAHAYGYGEKESYAYSAGGATKELKQVVTINGKEFTAETDNQLCGVDTIHFQCNLNYDYESITWYFGDGTSETGKANKYDKKYDYDGTYHAAVVIERLSSNLCQGQTAKDSIPITVTVGRMRINVDSIDQMICADNGKFRIYYSNPMQADLSNGSVFFNETAIEQGFTNSDNLVFTDKYFEITVPQTAKAAQKYGLNIELRSDCGNDTIEIPFTVNYRASLNLAQRANDILAVYNNKHNENGFNFVSFQWYRNGEKMEGETDSYLNLHQQYDFESEFYVCMKTTEGDSLCSCPTKFVNYGENPVEVSGEQTINVSATMIEAGKDLYITTVEEGEYSWVDATGKALVSGKLPKGGSLITVPDKKGFSILSVTAENKRVFKILIK